MEYAVLAFSPAGTAYVAYQDEQAAERVSVSVFDQESGEWTQLGRGPVSPGTALYPDLALDANNVSRSDDDFKLFEYIFGIAMQ